MALNKQEIELVMNAIDAIEERKEHQYAAPTYRDVSLLKQLEAILALHQDENEVETIKDCIVLARYLADAYEKMWRIIYAQKYYQILMKLHFNYYQCTKTYAECGNDYYLALRCMNYYGKDSCDELREMAKVLLPLEKRSKIEKQILEDFHPLKHDPIECSEAYLAVIDDVEAELAQKGIPRRHFYEVNAMKQKILKKYGIKWKTMMELNPKVHFD